MVANHEHCFVFLWSMCFLLVPLAFLSKNVTSFGNLEKMMHSAFLFSLTKTKKKHKILQNWKSSCSILSKSAECALFVDLLFPKLLPTDNQFSACLFCIHKTMLFTRYLNCSWCYWPLQDSMMNGELLLIHWTSAYWFVSVFSKIPHNHIFNPWLSNFCSVQFL